MASKMNLCRPWGDWMLEEDDEQSQFVLKMTDEEWKECGKKAIIDRRGKGDLRPILNWLTAMDALRAEHKAKTAAPLIVRDMSPQAVSFRIWKDMVEEPAKYGVADWADWLVLNEQLCTGSGRWRVAAFWAERDAEEGVCTRERAAIQIQAAWRGHRVRDTLPGLSCEDCLARIFSPRRWNGQHLCSGCLKHRFMNFTPFIQPVVPTVPKAPKVVVDENDNVQCYGCGQWNCYVGDYGEYRAGYWCSRTCAYDF